MSPTGCSPNSETRPTTKTAKWQQEDETRKKQRITVGWKQSEAIVDITTAEVVEAAQGKHQADQKASRESLGNGPSPGRLEELRCSPWKAGRILPLDLDQSSQDLAFHLFLAP